MSELDLRVSVSHSEVDQYLRCERAHYYGYGLEIQRIGSSVALDRGTQGHSALEYFFTLMKESQEAGMYRPEDADMLLADTISTVDDENDTYAFDVIGYLNNFAMHGGLNYFRDKEILAVEKEFVYDDPNIETTTPFVVDLIFRDPVLNLIIVADHKFVYNFISDKDEELTPQLVKYGEALKRMGYPIDRLAYHQIRTRTDAKEKWTIDFRNPTVSRRAEVMREQELASKRIVERKRRLLVDREKGLAEWEADVLRVQNKNICGMCSFRSLCVAELNDSGADLVLNSEYTAKVRREITGDENA